MVKYQLYDMVSYGDGEPMIPFSVIKESDNFERIYSEFKKQKDPCVICFKNVDSELKKEETKTSKIYESPDGGKTVYQREVGEYNNKIKTK